MKKYRPRDAPVPGSSVSETHPGFWAEHIKLEDNIRKRWMRNYGRMFYGYQSNALPSRSEPYQNAIHGHGGAEKGLKKGHGCFSGPRWPPKGPIPQVTSDFRAPQEKSILTAPIGWYNYDDNRTEGNISGQAVGQLHEEVKPLKMAYDYPTPGNTQKHHVVTDHVTGYSSSFGHHSVQFRNQNQIYAGKPTSANDFHLQIRNSPQSDGAVQTKYPYHLDKSKSRSPSHESYVFKHAAVRFTPNRVDLDELAIDLEGCTWAELHRRIESVHPLEVCPKCTNRLGCTCVPRRREKIPEDEPGNGPDDVLPPWPPQIWCGPSYNGSRVGTTGDILRLRHRLSRDPQWKTPLNRIYDEMKAVNCYGDKSHAGEHWYSCRPCRIANEAARGTWLDEQLRKGNPFTTGDTQFKSCGYMKKL